VSREALSLDISRLVSKVVSGETIDTAEQGDELAFKYPDLGMTGAQIGQAIERAVGMVGLIRSAPEPGRPFRLDAPAPSPSAQNGGSSNGEARAPEMMSAPPMAEAMAVSPPASPVTPEWTISQPTAGRSIDDELAAAIDDEISGLLSERRASPISATSDSDIASPAPVEIALEAPAAMPAVTNGEHAEAPYWNGEANGEESPEPSVMSESSERAQREHGSLFSTLRRALFRRPSSETGP